MAGLISELLSRGPVLTDGAWGTELQARGLPAGEIPDTWNLSHPQAVKEVAQAYAESGSQVILTNTFRSNRIALGKPAGDAFVREVNVAGVEHSRAAAGVARIFASIGPSGKLLLNGELSPEELLDVFREQASFLAEAGAEGLVVETMSDLQEALAAALAARETGLPVVACMVFDSGKNRDRTMMGTTPEQAAEELTAAGVDVVGANCGNGIEQYIPVCRRLNSSTHLPVWIKPNAGLPELEDGRVVYRTTPGQFAAHVPGLLEAGASFIGGCCGTSPLFTRAVSELLRSH